MTMIFLIKNVSPFSLSQIYSIEPRYLAANEGLTATVVSLKLQLQSSHFNGRMQDQNNNGLLLRCTAQIGNLYQENTEIELGVPQRDPIPARGKYFFFYYLAFTVSRSIVSTYTLLLTPII